MSYMTAVFNKNSVQESIYQEPLLFKWKSFTGLLLETIFQEPLLFNWESSTGSVLLKVVKAEKTESNNNFFYERKKNGSHVFAFSLTASNIKCDYPYKSCTPVISNMITHDLESL